MWRGFYSQIRFRSPVNFSPVLKRPEGNEHPGDSAILQKRGLASFAQQNISHADSTHHCVTRIHTPWNQCSQKLFWEMLAYTTSWLLPTSPHMYSPSPRKASPSGETDWFLFAQIHIHPLTKSPHRNHDQPQNSSYSRNHRSMLQWVRQ